MLVCVATIKICKRLEKKRKENVYIYVYVGMQHTLCECMYAVQPSLTLYDMHQVLYMK